MKSKYFDYAGKLQKHLPKIAGVKAGFFGEFKQFPINIEIDLTNRCQLGCAGCHFAHTHTRGPLANSQKIDGQLDCGDVMDTRLLLSLSEELSNADVSFTFTGGGEPTLHPDFDLIVGLLPQLMGIYTNGCKISKERAELMKERMSWIYVSLDYATPEQYEANKGTPLFEKAIAGIRNLVAAKGKATIGLGFIISELNWTDLRYMADLGRSLGVDYVQFRPMIQFDINNPGVSQTKGKWSVSAASVIKALKLEYGEFVQGSINRFIEVGHWAGHGYKTCYWSGLQSVITPNGHVWTCVNKRGMPQEKVGDLNLDSFTNIWERVIITEVNDRCRIMCRGHIANQLIDQMDLSPSSEHDFFV